MKKILLSAIAAAALSSTAFAADLPARTYTKAPAVVAPIATWTGCYIGGNVGGGWAKTEQTRWTVPYFLLKITVRTMEAALSVAARSAATTNFLGIG